MNPFNPPIRTLMGPGPPDVHPRVLTDSEGILSDMGAQFRKGVALPAAREAGAP
ncbi:MAG: hypothetical protein ACYSX0_06500 [Planctomycetota bacterium]|jgi:hypothetical protein